MLNAQSQYNPVRYYQITIQAAIDDAGNIVALDLPANSKDHPTFKKILLAACAVFGVETERKIRFREFL